MSESNTEYIPSKDYDPLKGQQITLSNIGNIFDPDSYIKSMKIPMSSDGSIYNLGTYYMYCRENIVGRPTTAYLLQYIWGLISGFATYAFCFYCLSGIVDKDGNINSFYNAGSACYCNLVVVHHLQIAIETRNWTFLIVFIYIANFGLYILTVFLNDSYAGGQYYRNQFSELFGRPLTYFALLLSASISTLPRLAWICLDRAIWRPEFAKVKGK